MLAGPAEAEAAEPSNDERARHETNMKCRGSGQASAMVDIDALNGNIEAATGAAGAPLASQKSSGNSKGKARRSPGSNKSVAAEDVDRADKSVEQLQPSASRLGVEVEEI